MYVVVQGLQQIDVHSQLAILLSSILYFFSVDALQRTL